MGSGKGLRVLLLRWLLDGQRECIVKDDQSGIHTNE